MIRLGRRAAELTAHDVARAARSGAVIDGWRNGRRARLPARILERLCTQDPVAVDPRGVSLTHVEVVGAVDLRSQTVTFPLRFERCTFTEAIRLEGASLPAISILNSHLPGFLGNGLSLEGDLDLSGTLIEGQHATSASTSKRAAVWLCESRIGGRLLCVDTRIHAPGERAIQADRMHVGGTVRLLHAFETRGEIRLLGAQIDGSLDLTGAHLTDPLDGLALDLGDAHIGGSLFLIPSQTGRRPSIQGRLDMGSTRISGQLLIRGLLLEAATGAVSGMGYSTRRRGGTAISAPRLAVGGDVTFESGCEIRGGVDLSLSEVGDVWVDAPVRFVAPGATAIDLTNATVSGSVTYLPGVETEGTICLTGSRVRGSLTLQGTTWRHPGGRSAIRAVSAIVDGDVELQRMTATEGEVNFRSATIGGIVDVAEATLANPHGYSTLSLHRATIKGSVRLVNGFRSTGLVLLSRCMIEGTLDLRGGHFDCPEPSRRNRRRDAIQAVSTTVRGGMSLGWTSVAPSVDFTRASTTGLGDDPANWPERFVISGFTYDRFEDPTESGGIDLWDWKARVRWLRSQRDFDSSTYEQAARAFRQHGFALEAERILMAQRREAHRAERSRRRVKPLRGRTIGGLARDGADLLLRGLVGYGYRPSRVLWILASLIVLVAITLEAPTAAGLMRATDPKGDVYQTAGMLRTADTSPPSTPSPKTRPADACGDGAVRCFNAEFYAVDTVIPIVSLGQRSTWYVDEGRAGGTALAWWLDLATLLGWLLSSVFVLSFTRLARSTE